MSLSIFLGMFYIDIISIVMIMLISFIGLVVYSFSTRYMQGDNLYTSFLLKILMIIISVMFITITDNLLLFLIEWFYCNWILTKLIVHTSTWKASQASGKLALNNFIAGFYAIALAFILMYVSTGSLSIQYIIHNKNDSWLFFIALIMLLLGALRQSAMWPFHRWLISSLNAPTPVSALMHAGIVNGGGFLLIRCAPLYLNSPEFLNCIFIIGLISSLLGSLWKLMQNDIKRMLACSTIAQMGFMFMQFGLGFFASGLAHICWHGMFKAYLFLSSASQAQEKKVNLRYAPSLFYFLFSFFCGILGSCIFLRIDNKKLFPLDSSFIIIGIVFIACAQLTLMILSEKSFKKYPLAILVTIVTAGLYGINVYYFDLILSPLHLMRPQSLSLLHLIGFMLLSLSWLLSLFFRYANYKIEYPKWLLYLYVTALNSSQPHPDAITSYRKAYSYRLENYHNKN